MKKIALIGSTGSIGTQTLNVVRRHSDKFKIVSLSAGTNEKAFTAQVKEFNPSVATFGGKVGDFCNFKNTQFFFGENSFTNAIIEEADIVVVALVGFKGLIAVLDAINKGKNVALANKESLVVGGEIVMKLAKEKGVKILPIDSEHSAIWQALNFDFTTPFNKIILTASGGAFRDYSKSQLENATSKQALKHPNWLMGAKITIDCATLVNKGFEVIEAKWLYNTFFDKIDVVIHRESIVHSMVELKDRGIIAQMSYPSMELPIALALSYPQRIESNIESINFAKLQSLTFALPDNEKFPCLNLVIESGKKGGCYPAVVNGANEELVKLFLKDKIKFTDIYKGLCSALESFNGNTEVSLENLKLSDDYARRHIRNIFGE
ncbi:MAG: 1-deoxy-D-xylulose-5-phosphate reductoisomerase [Clostridia bacterium]|nr:1-deoxy-D-xylulose-5-phosphate reductoisomerase [Clostridia bacterium]